MTQITTKTTKLFFIFLATVTVGFIILPSAVSLLAGQHYWYDVMDRSNDDVPCRKCHGDVYEEIYTHIGPHSGETSIDAKKYEPGGHQSMGEFKCTYCHSWYYTGQELARVSNGQVIPGEGAHAATTVSCIACHKGQKEVYTYYESWDKNWGIAQFSGPAYHEEYCNEHDSCVTSGCHDDPSDWDEFPEHGIWIAGDDNGIPDGDCKRCHCGLIPGGDPGNYEDYHVYHVPPAGGFGITYFNTTGAYGWDTGSMAAHRAFVDESKENGMLQDENEACVACHTAIAVRINWTHKRSLEFDVGLMRDMVTTETGQHNWTVTNWMTGGIANISVYGDTMGTNASTTYNSNIWQGEVPGVNYQYT